MRSVRATGWHRASFLRLIAQLAELLQTFHDRGYLVQDLKPENVLWDPRSENVYLVDFAAVCPRLEDGTLDEHSVAFGTQTHGFAAPEFADLWGRSDARFDIYSLGATAYHLLTGINPERLALEQGSEYPELPLHALGALPVDVAELVRGCLAPVGERFKSAAAVFTAAEAARLRLSRSRPLDVRGLRVEYLAEGMTLAWHLPADPRIDRVRILRARGDEEVCVFEGGRVQRWCAEEPPADDAEYRVETGLERRGRRSTAAAAAPVWRRAPRRWSSTRRPTSAASGSTRRPRRTRSVWRFAGATDAPVDANRGCPCRARAWRVVAACAARGCTAHYAAFALYPADDAAASAPSSARFGTATALRALPEVDDLTVTQEAERVRLTWADDDPIWRVAAVGERRSPPARCWRARRSDRPSGARWRSDPLPALRAGGRRGRGPGPRTQRASLAASPELRVTAGPAHALVEAGELDPRFTRFDVSWRRPAMPMPEMCSVCVAPGARRAAAESGDGAHGACVRGRRRTRPRVPLRGVRASVACAPRRPRASRAPPGRARGLAPKELTSGAESTGWRYRRATHRSRSIQTGATPRG